MIYIASDHGGFRLKKEIIEYLKTKNLEVEDKGPTEFDPNDDYPEYVLKVIKAINTTEGDLGILICRNGAGVNIMANKYKGIRAALSFTPEHAATTRNDDHTNVLTLGADFITPDQAKTVVSKWLETPYSTDQRHLRRLAEVDEFISK